MKDRVSNNRTTEQQNNRTTKQQNEDVKKIVCVLLSLSNMPSLDYEIEKEKIKIKT